MLCGCLLRLGQSLVVIDVVFLVAGLPSIFSARLGFQDLVFSDLTSMLFFIARGWLHAFIDDHVFVGSPFCHICYSRCAELVSGALVSSIQSFVVPLWYESLVCACLVCEVLLIS
ncbi:hypothetical protein F2Q70_00010012 [Brassica cretica]|uniref:Uncharacterized protein n=1 Tax=Brassica cretica TaxID=69181 RepID=A0A8S9LRX3_BRACR|nr:hypothetical protein F2Q70_00010012 [Brassica cretica]